MFFCVLDNEIYRIVDKFIFNNVFLKSIFNYNAFPFVDFCGIWSNFIVGLTVLFLFSLIVWLICEIIKHVDAIIAF